jgi:hypothetical protein
MKTIATMLFAGLAMLANAQTMVTGDTMGKDKTALFVSSNALAVKDFTVLTSSTLQYWRGLTNRIDAFAGITATTALGQEQTGVTAGANVNLAKTKLASVAAFNTLTTPLQRRQDASAAVWFAAGIFSHTFGKDGPSVYSGFSATVPVGHTANKLFTPASVLYNIPVGLAIPKGKWLLFVEYDFGRTLQTGGLGAAYGF